MIRVAACGLITLSLLALQSKSIADDRNSPIVFNRDVRPILSENCFFCHGQDASKREADLRLDTLEGQRTSDVVIPGKPERSELIARIDSQDPDTVMPPPGSNHSLTESQKSTLKRWIAQGADFQQHWSWIPPQPIEPPLASSENPSSLHPIDRFVRDRLASLGLSGSPEADRTTLIRRLSLDLIGLPPTIEEVNDFLKDKSPIALERVVDRLLDSPHYGERMALPWLDAARYADTHGYQKDNLRTMWAWRDWVIAAFNANMPFDQFTVEQLAGDLLPNPSIAQRIATGFHRNHRINGEAGAIDEEFRTEYVADRVETTSTVWLGLTVACARCHDHKFDPIAQRDYYQLFAFFNNVAENGVDGIEASAPPTLKIQVPGFDRQIAEAQQNLESLQQRFEKEALHLTREKLEWEQRMQALLDQPDGSRVWSLVEPIAMHSKEKMTFQRLSDYSILAAGPNPLNDVHTVRFAVDRGMVTGIRLEAISDDSNTNGRFARSFDGSFVLSGFDVQVVQANNETDVVKIRSAVARPARENWPIAAVLDRDADTGWSETGEKHREPAQGLLVFDEPIYAEAGTQLMVRLRYESKEEQSMIARFRLATTDRREPQLDTFEELPASWIEALLVSEQDRTPVQRSTLDQAFRGRTPKLEGLRAEITREQERLSTLKKSSETSVMVMQELEKRRETFIHLRGAYDKPGDRVEANVPASLTPIEGNRPLNRLDLAQWIVHPSNPLTARVAVNRYWQMYFGTGLVKTTEDFGTQGEWPSHPELLDWLALEFIRSGWDVKAMQRLIVTSATYRQSSQVRPELLERDPENRYLTRGPRFRLPAHLLRDQALFVSGLLVPKIGGPPAKTYQPDGLWEGVAGINSNTTVYRRDSGANLYRRSLYTFWKRAVPPPAMMIFDAADREVCSVKPRVTNTPLQALNLLNDVTYVEAARGLATRILKLGMESDAQRIDRLFQFVLARSPDGIENKQLVEALGAYRARFAANPTQANEFISIGESNKEHGLDSVELAAWTTLATLVLNLDESVTKE